MSASFGQLLRRHRTNAGFSQEHLVGLAGLSVESIGALERGTRRAPYRDTVGVLADALKLDADDRAALEATANAARSRGARNVPVTEPPPPNPHLPLQSTSFIGRNDDIAGITALLEESRLATITGSGGVGKTRTAIEVASRLPASRWRDIRFVDLSRLTDGALVTAAIAAALELLGDGAANVPDLVASLRSSEALLVLDNCEHVIAEVALFVSAALASCPGLAFLASSRERLAVNGEVVYRLPSLTVPLDVGLTLAEARNYAAVELFVQRATAIDRSAAFDDATVPGIVEICRRLDGIPLAIELAAARVQTLGVAALGARLREGLALSGAARNLPSRQQTVEATIRWSYDLLEEHERLVLQRLSLFVGGFTLAAAESLRGVGGIAASDVADLVSSLVDKSLVNVARAENYVRFGLLDSVRSFAFDRLRETGDLALFSQRHAEWVAAFADWVDAERAKIPVRRLRTEVDPELENARAALTWTLEQQTEMGAVIAGRIVGGLRTIWLTSGLRAECRRWAHAILDLIDEDRHARVVAPLLRALVQIADSTELFALGERALPVFERIGDRMGVVLLLSHMSLRRHKLGFLDEADVAIEKAGAIFAAGDLPRLMPYTAFLDYRAQLRLEQGRYDEAFADIDEMGAILSSIGDVDALPWRILRANAEFAVGRTADAIRGLEDVVERARNLPVAHTRVLRQAHAELAIMHALAGDIDSAHLAAREALWRTMKVVTPDEEWQSLFRALALIAALRGQALLAAQLLGMLDAGIDWGTTARPARAALIETITTTLSPQAIERAKTEGSAFTIERALAEAQKI
jgi:predicted ATPase